MPKFAIPGATESSIALIPKAVSVAPAARFKWPILPLKAVIKGFLTIPRSYSSLFPSKVDYSSFFGSVPKKLLIASASIGSPIIVAVACPLLRSMS